MEVMPVEKIGSDIVETIKLYRGAEYLKKSQELIDTGSPQKLADAMRELFDNSKALHSKPRFEIDGTFYWMSILRAKLEIIALIFGLPGLEEMHHWLEDHPENDEYHFSARLSVAADGLAGWRH